MFGCERFHKDVYGKQFMVEPLEMIQHKNLIAAPQRLQNMLMRLQHYAVRIRYSPGRKLMLPGGPSCLPSNNIDQIKT